MYYTTNSSCKKELGTNSVSLVSAVDSNCSKDKFCNYNINSLWYLSVCKGGLPTSRSVLNTHSTLNEARQLKKINDINIQHNSCYNVMIVHTLVSTSVHGSLSILLSHELSLWSLILESEVLFFCLAANLVDLRTRARGVGWAFCGLECFNTSTSVNWTAVPPPRVRKISPYMQHKMIDSSS